MKRGWISTLRVSLGILILGGSAVFTANVLMRSGTVLEFHDVRAQHRPSDQWIVDRQGTLLESIRTGKSVRSLDWTRLDQVSPLFVQTLLHAEDRRFYQHWGVDLRALIAATAQSLKRVGESLIGQSGTRTRGASTITMQLVKSLNGRSPDANVFERLVWKLNQMASALALELKWTKSEILEAYLNRVSFRGEIQGISAASRGLFGKAPAALGDAESAILVALIRSPNAGPRQVGRRACALLEVDRCAEVQDLIDRHLDQPFKIVRERNLIPVLSSKFVVSKEGTWGQSRLDRKSSVIQTTLDARVQRLAIEKVREQLIELKRQNVGDASVLILETRSGKPLAYVANGGPGYSTAVQIDGVLARRQLGSTIKPFIYAEAFENNFITTTTLLMDSPENVAVGSGQVYQPRNYDHQFRGAVGAAEALASSLNVPAVRTLDLVGERRVTNRLRRLGFERLLEDDQYGPSLALGTVDASLWELANAYRRLSLYAKPVAPTAMSPSTKADPAMEVEVYSDLTKRRIFEALSVPENRRLTFGSRSVLQLPFPAAVKTGTSKDMRDNWCVGFTSEYTVAVWVGNFNGDPMWNVSGVSGAAPLWRSLMLALHQERKPEDPRMEYQKPDQPLPRKSLVKIEYPVKEMLIGLDPDIPKRSQRVPLRAIGARRGYMFYINGQKFAPAERVSLWTPEKGRHRVELRNHKGDKVDEVSFVVR